MDKLVQNPVSLIGDICLIAFLLPGHLENWPNSNGYQISLGILQPGWCQITVDPPVNSGLVAGISFQVAFVWVFLFVFIVTKAMTTQVGDRPTDLRKLQEQYRRSTRRPRY